MAVPISFRVDVFQDQCPDMTHLWGMKDEYVWYLRVATGIVLTAALGLTAAGEASAQTFSSSSTTNDRPTNDRPNILFIVLDDLGDDALVAQPIRRVAQSVTFPAEESPDRSIRRDNTIPPSLHAPT